MGTVREGDYRLARLAAETFEGGDYFIKQGDLEGRIVAYMAKLPPGDASGEIEGERGGGVVLQTQGSFSMSSGLAKAIFLI